MQQTYDHEAPLALASRILRHANRVYVQHDLGSHAQRLTLKGRAAATLLEAATKLTQDVNSLAGKEPKVMRQSYLQLFDIAEQLISEAEQLAQ